jgi:hypothetical protein
MALAQRVAAYISAEESLANEDRGEIKREYVAGRGFAMSGANEAHGMIVANSAS